MEVEPSNPNSPHKDVGQAGDNDRGNWHRRLRLRKPSASSLTVKTTTEEEKEVIEPPKKPSKNEHRNNQMASSSGSKLTFTCSNCKDKTLFSPQDLLNHFSVFHGGNGETPSFPCDMCSFTSLEFTVLQQHRMKHKKCRLACEVCNDNVLKTVSQLRKHCKAHHSLNRQYHCEKCKFSTKELKVFVHHSCPTTAEPPKDSTEISSIQPINGKLNGSLVTGVDEAPQKEELLMHMTTDCRQAWRRRNWWKKKEAPHKRHTSSTTDLLKPDTQWTSSGFLPFSAAGLLDQDGALLNPAKTLEETQLFLERTVNSGKKWPVILKGEAELASQSCTVPLPVPDLRNSGQNELSGLMEKNNISVPPDCTTKVVGFKMVDGKNHLILKVIPLSKSKVSPETGEISPGLNQVETDCVESSGPQVDQTCAEMVKRATKQSLFPFCNNTSSGAQLEKQQSEKQHEAPTDDGPHVNPEPSQFAVSGTEENLNVANEVNTEKHVSPNVISDANDTHDLNGVAANVAVEESSLRGVDSQTLSNVQNVECTKEHTDSLKAIEDLKENRPELATSHNNSSCHGDLAASIPSDLGTLEKRFNSQPSTLTPTLSEENRSPDVDLDSLDKESGEDAVLQSPHHHNEQQIHPSKEKEAIFEPNIINATFVSLHKHATDSPFHSLGEDRGLLFQDSGDEYTNSIDPREAPVPLDPSCTTETVEEANELAVVSLGDSCHNPDLLQTLDELPVTNVSHLLDDRATIRGITTQSEELGVSSTHQEVLHSPKAIPIPVTVANDKDSTHSTPVIEPTMKRKRQGEVTMKNSQEHIPKARKQLVRNCIENDPPASVLDWQPVPRAVERTLWLLPVFSSQLIKVPRLNQPVIVLNHPDTDIPEVANIMKVVHKHKGAVQKVVLSQRTLKALSELNCDAFRKSIGADCHSSHCRRVWPKDTVKERFLLKLKLKRLCGQKYKVASAASKPNGCQTTFRCWFCGRIFRNQEAWVGHGQRHLMEATRDWNKQFSSEGQRNSLVQPYFH